MNNSKKKLISEIKTKFYIEDILEVYDIPKKKIIKKYKEKRRNKDIGSYALEYVENMIKKDCDFLARIDFIYNATNGGDGIGEIAYYTSRKEYNEEIYESYDCGRPISCKVIKNKGKDLGIELERIF